MNIPGDSDKRNASRSTGKFNKEWSDVLNKTVWYAESEQSSTNPLGGSCANIASIMRLKGTKKSRHYSQIVGILKCIGYKSNFDPKPLIRYLDSVPWNKSPEDAVVYKNLRDIYEKMRPLKSQNMHDRGDSAAKKILAQVANAGGGPIATYLDYGCGPGDTATSIQRELNLADENVHGVDIVKHPQCNLPNFSRIDPETNRIPYPNNTFDLITVSYVLHHIPEDKRRLALDELFRVVKPSGVVLIREHNVPLEESKEMTITLDFMHDVYAKVVGSQHTDIWKETPLYYSKYASADAWDAMMESSGFALSEFQPYFNPNIDINPLQACVRIYCKRPEPDSEINRGQELRPIFRVLDEHIPRAKYHRRAKDMKDVLHWGQRKLLLSEIEFLTLFYKSERDESKKIYVIYAGASPGTHVKFLAKLFPKVYFVLYDPREFDPVLNACTRITTHVQLFTDDTAQEWTEDKHPDKHILFVSDIRTAEPQTMPPEEVETHIKQDNEWQKKWWIIMNPVIAMFKFRLPWDDSHTEYPRGDIYLGIFPPETSTETRLIVLRGAPMQKYNHREYEERLFRFNTVERLLQYENVLSDISPDKKEGLDNRYDSAAEIHVINSYLTYFNEPRDRTASIIKMSKSISKTLSSSRNLASDQPLKKHSKEIVKTLKELGEVPDDAPYTRKTYNTYVVGSYDTLVERGILDPRLAEF